jgi:hypothetical protein
MDIEKLSNYQLQNYLIHYINIDFENYLYELYLITYLEEIIDTINILEKNDIIINNHIKDEIDYQYEIKKHLEYEMSKIFDTTYQHILKLKKIESNINNYNENQLKNILYSYLYKKYKN